MGSMNAKNYICILVGAALLVSCAEVTKPTGAKPSRGEWEPGKRTEQGTVIALTSTQITLRCAGSSGTTTTWIITRTVNTVVVSGTLAVGNLVTVDFNTTDGHTI